MHGGGCAAPVRTSRLRTISQDIDRRREGYLQNVCGSKVFIPPLKKENRPFKAVVCG